MTRPSSKAVVVKGTPALAHTSQLLPLDEHGKLVGNARPAEQIDRGDGDDQREIDRGGRARAREIQREVPLAEVLLPRLAKAQPRDGRAGFLIEMDRGAFDYRA